MSQLRLNYAVCPLDGLQAARLDVGRLEQEVGLLNR
jgi:hypothetical protein